MKKLIVSLAALGLCALSVQAEAKSAAVRQAQANVAAVRAAAAAVVVSKGSAEAIAELKAAVTVVRTEVAGIRSDTSATKDQLAAARFEAVADVLTLKQLKAIAKAAKRGK